MSDTRTPTEIGYYKTRDGKNVFINALPPKDFKPEEIYTVSGYIFDEGAWHGDSWTLDGRSYDGPDGYDGDDLMHFLGTTMPKHLCDHCGGTEPEHATWCDTHEPPTPKIIQIQCVPVLNASETQFNLYMYALDDSGTIWFKTDRGTHWSKQPFACHKDQSCT